VTAPDATATVPRGAFWRLRRDARYRLMKLVLWLVTHAYLRFRFEGRERLPAPPYVLCFNHLDWADPLILVSVLPSPRRIYFFGPKERDMRVGWKNRLMTWVGNDVPFKPDKSHMLDAVRRVKEVLGAGHALAIAGEGRVAEREDEVLPLNEGAAFFALHGQVPLVPVAINGTRLLRFGKRIRIRVGEPIVTTGRRPTGEEVKALTAEAHAELGRLVLNYHDPSSPRRFDVWLTELFNSPRRGAPARDNQPPG
jgi:1-acyl-sn-glycerol-3-phosphate acyltransferase